MTTATAFQRGDRVIGRATASMGTVIDTEYGGTPQRPLVRWDQDVLAYEEAAALELTSGFVHVGAVRILGHQLDEIFKFFASAEISPATYGEMKRAIEGFDRRIQSRVRLS